MIKKSDVLKLLYEVKDNRGIPINYGTIMDLIRQVRDMKEVCSEEEYLRLKNNFDVVCPSCGRVVKSDEVFCPSCGMRARYGWKSEDTMTSREGDIYDGKEKGVGVNEKNTKRKRRFKQGKTIIV